MARKSEPTRADLERQIFELSEKLKNDAELDRIRALRERQSLQNMERLLMLLETKCKKQANAECSICDRCQYRGQCSFAHSNFTYCPKTAAPIEPVVAFDALREKGFFMVTLQ